MRLASGIIFTFIEGDIRNYEVCNDAVKGVDYVLHQAALGSVPRSIADPITSNAANITGFLNMLTAAKEEQVKALPMRQVAQPMATTQRCLRLKKISVTHYHLML